MTAFGWEFSIRLQFQLVRHLGGVIDVGLKGNLLGLHALLGEAAVYLLRLLLGL